MAKGPPLDPASAGHKLGQLVGDWFEEYFVHPLLQAVSERLRLFLDSRFQPRQARGDKIVWRDDDGHAVDYDFVMELNGTKEQLGIPVAFIESFWRRGARHSRDKARDDSGKLLPMRDVHPTARFLGIVAGGDFTGPARQFVQQRGIDLFYIPKGKIVEAFSAVGLQMDYPDRLPEPEKSALAATFSKMLTPSAGTARGFDGWRRVLRHPALPKAEWAAAQLCGIHRASIALARSLPVAFHAKRWQA